MTKLNIVSGFFNYFNLNDIIINSFFYTLFIFKKIFTIGEIIGKFRVFNKFRMASSETKMQEYLAALKELGEKHNVNTATK